MKFCRGVLAGIVFLSTSGLLTGCANTEDNHTSPYHPGPVVGANVGVAAGAVVGNVAGVGVGAVEGVAQGVAAPFDPSYRMVRQWRKETTPDGRVIQVPYDVLVDKDGRPVKMPAPTGNPPIPPPPATTPAPAPAPAK
jgi:hypothetical protein